MPTTTIGSFPQTKEVRVNRAAFRKGEITEEQYVAFNKKKIADEKSDVLGDIDVLIIDEKKHRIVVAEVKNFDFSKNPYEIQAEYQKMFVDGKKKSFATKHFSVMFLSLSTAFYTNTICTVNFSLFTI